jgi:hypothetical protein
MRFRKGKTDVSDWGEYVCWLNNETVDQGAGARILCIKWGFLVLGSSALAQGHSGQVVLYPEPVEGLEMERSTNQEPGTSLIHSVAPRISGSEVFP